MADPTLPRLAADRNRLFGILAWRLDFVSREAVVQALHTWALEKRHPLGQVLVEQGDLSPEDRMLLEEVVRRHLERHGGDPVVSLAAITGGVALIGRLAQLQAGQPEDAEVPRNPLLKG